MQIKKRTVVRSLVKDFLCNEITTMMPFSELSKYEILVHIVTTCVFLNMKITYFIDQDFDINALLKWSDIFAESEDKFFTFT